MEMGISRPLLGQYKVPYEKGQMPVPYFDANDGYPYHLLLNDGKGNFAAATEQAGLGRKRFRRVYSASLIDLDRDGDLDLIVVSDFHGIDAFENNRRGAVYRCHFQVVRKKHARWEWHTHLLILMPMALPIF